MFLKSSDFVSIQISLVLSNVTSQSPIRTSESTRLVDFSNETLTLTLPIRSCSSGHHLELEMKVVRGKDSREFATTAYVQDAFSPPPNENEKPEDVVLLKLVQFNTSAWKAMREFLEGEAQTVSDLFDRMKGNE